MTSPEKWEINQLIKAGVLDVTEYPTFDAEDGQVPPNSRTFLCRLRSHVDAVGACAECRADLPDAPRKEYIACPISAKQLHVSGASGRNAKDGLSM